MDKGHIRQVAAPETLYREPADLMVAGFVGAGAVLPIGNVSINDDRTCSVRLGDTDIAARVCPNLVRNRAIAQAGPKMSGLMMRGLYVDRSKIAFIWGGGSGCRCGSGRIVIMFYRSMPTDVRALAKTSD